MRALRTAQNVQQPETVVQEEATVQEQLTYLEQSLDNNSRATVLTVLDDEKEYDLKKTYSENSIYMQLNPLQTAQTELDLPGADSRHQYGRTTGSFIYIPVK